MILFFGVVFSLCSYISARARVCVCCVCVCRRAAPIWATALTQQHDYAASLAWCGHCKRTWCTDESEFKKFRDVDGALARNMHQMQNKRWYEGVQLCC